VRFQFQKKRERFERHRQPVDVRFVRKIRWTISDVNARKGSNSLRSICPFHIQPRPVFRPRFCNLGSSRLNIPTRLSRHLPKVRVSFGFDHRLLLAFSFSTPGRSCIHPFFSVLVAVCQRMFLSASLARSMTRNTLTSPSR